jgi:putative transposase
MSPLAQRQTLLPMIEQACAAGARLYAACRQIGLSVRTVQRWQKPQARCSGDRRTAQQRRHVRPANKLSEAEEQAILALLNSAEFNDLPPSQIVPRFADKGRYVASEATLYRLLRKAGQMAHRRIEKPAQKRSKPRALVATQPDQIYCWDITYLPTTVLGAFFYLYLFEDLFSRKIVGWQIFDSESAEHASELLLDICTRQGIKADQLTLHSDNGSPMKGQTMLAMLQKLQVAHTRSRPSVSNDNPYIEAIFKTLKYRPNMPVKPFEDLSAARRWAGELVDWYNNEHRHSAIGFVTPSQRHAACDQELLDQRTKVYEQARQKHPERWSKNTRCWTYVSTVHLNPDKPDTSKQALSSCG